MTTANGSTGPTGPTREARRAAEERRERFYSWLVSGFLGVVPVAAEEIGAHACLQFPDVYPGPSAVGVELSNMMKKKTLSQGRMYPHLYRPRFGHYSITPDVRLDDHYSSPLVGFMPVAARRRQTQRSFSPAQGSVVVRGAAAGGSVAEVGSKPDPASGLLVLRPIAGIEGLFHDAGSNRLVRVVEVTQL